MVRKTGIVDLKLVNPSWEKNTSAFHFLKAFEMAHSNQMNHKNGCLAGGYKQTGITFLNVVNTVEYGLSKNKMKVC